MYFFFLITFFNISHRTFFPPVNNLAQIPETTFLWHGQLPTSDECVILKWIDWSGTCANSTCTLGFKINLIFSTLCLPVFDMAPIKVTCHASQHDYWLVGGRWTSCSQWWRNPWVLKGCNALYNAIKCPSDDASDSRDNIVAYFLACA